MKIPTLTKGFLRSMGPTLGVATLNDREPETKSSELPSIDNGATGPEFSDWTSVAPEGHDGTKTIQTEMEGKEHTK